MKKVFLFGIVIYCFLSFESYSKALIKDKSKCPKNIICQKGEILGDDGICYSCNSDKAIEIQCIGRETARNTCPNRLLSHPILLSYLKCPEGQEEFKGHEGFCLTRCREGFEGIEEFMCKNKETGEFYLVDY